MGLLNPSSHPSPSVGSEPASPRAAAGLVSIGVPIYNEARYLEQAVASLLAQNYPRTEIIICDNGSTDDSEAICRGLTEAHANVQYHRSPVNRGPASNFNRAFDLATGSYFMWGTGHDLWSPNFVSGAVEALEAHPSATLAFGSTLWIDAEGQPWSWESGWSDTRGMTNVERFFTVFWGNMHPIMGVIRAERLQSMLRISSMAGADLMALLELSLTGDFLHVPDAYWYRREFRGRVSYRERLRRYGSKEVGLVRSSAERLFPFLRMPFKLTRIVARSPVPISQKAVILSILYPTMVARYFAARG